MRKNRTFIYYIIIVLLVAGVFVYTYTYTILKMGYKYGQVDALTGDVRVKEIEPGQWEYSKNFLE